MMLPHRAVSAGMKRATGHLQASHDVLGLCIREPGAPRGIITPDEDVDRLIAFARDQAKRLPLSTYTVARLLGVLCCAERGADWVEQAFLGLVDGGLSTALAESAMAELALDVVERLLAIQENPWTFRPRQVF